MMGQTAGQMMGHIMGQTGQNGVEVSRTCPISAGHSRARTHPYGVMSHVSHLSHGTHWDGTHRGTVGTVAVGQGQSSATLRDRPSPTVSGVVG